MGFVKLCLEVRSGTNDLIPRLQVSGGSQARILICLRYHLQFPSLVFSLTEAWLAPAGSGVTAGAVVIIVCGVIGLSWLGYYYSRRRLVAQAIADDAAKAMYNTELKQLAMVFCSWTICGNGLVTWMRW